MLGLSGRCTRDERRRKKKTKGLARTGPTRSRRACKARAPRIGNFHVLNKHFAAVKASHGVVQCPVFVTIQGNS